MDLYREFFHPSLLQEDGGDLKKKFAVSVHDWTAPLSGELERELQATSLRLEKKVNSLVKREEGRWLEKAERRDLGPLLYAKDLTPWTTPEIGEGLLTGKLDWHAYWSYFKNPKHFFEGKGRETLREALESPLEEIVKEAVDRIQSIYAQYYCDGARLRKMSVCDHFMDLWLEWEREMREIDGSGEETAALEELGRSLDKTEQQLRQIY
ncbi:hypothetical protein D3C72_952950 [compost metagenome]